LQDDRAAQSHFSHGTNPRKDS